MLTLSTTFLAVAAVLFIILQINEAKGLVIVSGSMQPEIPAGSYVLTHTQAANDVEVGDVVAVKLDDGSNIIHRVVHVATSADGTTTLRLKGDANSSEDPDSYVASTVFRPILTIPELGRAVIMAEKIKDSAVSNPWILLGFGSGVLLMGLSVHRSPVRTSVTPHRVLRRSEEYRN